MKEEVEGPRFRRGENATKPYGGKISDDPFSQALHKSAVARGFESQNVLANALGIRQSTVHKWYRGKSIPTPSGFGDLLVLLSLNDEEREPLVEAYANRFVKQKELRAKNHSRFQHGVTGSQLIKEQKKLPYRTYNMVQAAVELGVTRQMVSNLRKKFGLPQLLTEENLTMLKGHLEKTKGRREKFQQLMMKKRAGNLGETDLTIFQ